MDSEVRKIRFNTLVKAVSKIHKEMGEHKLDSIFNKYQNISGELEQSKDMVKRCEKLSKLVLKEIDRALKDKPFRSLRDLQGELDD